MSRKNDATNEDVNNRNARDFESTQSKWESEADHIRYSWKSERKALRKKSKKRGWFW